MGKYFQRKWQRLKDLIYGNLINQWENEITKKNSHKGFILAIDKKKKYKHLVNIEKSFWSDNIEKRGK